MAGTYRLKRVYEAPDPNDGFRVLVDRLWPRGLSKSDAHIDMWPKDTEHNHAVIVRDYLTSVDTP